MCFRNWLRIAGRTKQKIEPNYFDVIYSVAETMNVELRVSERNSLMKKLYAAVTYAVWKHSYIETIMMSSF